MQLKRPREFTFRINEFDLDIELFKEYQRIIYPSKKLKK